MGGGSVQLEGGVKPRDQCKKKHTEAGVGELFVDQEEAQSGGSREVGQES